MSNAKSALDGVIPFNGTPMDPAVRRALTAPYPYFATDAASISRNRRWIMLMTDGAWNLIGGDPAAEIAQLASNKITVFGAGYGLAGEVNYATVHSPAAPMGNHSRSTAERG
jgi:hypothetical protein